MKKTPQAGKDKQITALRENRRRIIDTTLRPPPAARLSPSDRAWLRMDDPRNPMVITILLVFSKPLDLARLKTLLVDGLRRFPRFRWRLSSRPSLWPRWEQADQVDLERHLAVFELPDGFGQDELEQLVGVLMSNPLDFSLPLWKFYVFQGYNGGSALAARLHHCLGDGIALMQLLLSLDEEAGGDANQTGLAAATRLASALEDNLLTPGSLGDELRRLLSQRGHVRKRLGQAFDLAEAAADLALRQPAPPNPLVGALTGEKRCVWSSPVNLEQVRSIGKKSGVTVNDVLVSATAGALRRYLADLGGEEHVDGLRAAIPVNLRLQEIDQDLGTQLGAIFLDLPVGIDDPLERLELVHASMQALKSSAEPLAVFYALNLLGAFPGWTEQLALDFFDDQASLVLTNLPGPRSQLSLADAPVELLMAWPPQLGQIGLGVSIVSYNGQVRLGFAADAGLVDDPERLVELFEEQFARLQEAVCERGNSTLTTAISDLERSLGELSM